MTERLIYLLFAAVLLALTVYGVVRAVRSSRGSRAVVIAALIVWFLATVFMTIRPGSGRGSRLNLIPIVVDGPGAGFDVVLNVGVFVPLGLLLAAIGWRVLPVLGLALAVSLSIEITQFATDLGRTADVNDLITNTLGAGLGWCLAWAIGRRTRAANVSDAV